MKKVLMSCKLNLKVRANLKVNLRKKERNPKNIKFLEVSRNKNNNNLNQ